MARCIFCDSAGPFSTKEHILPESLGGDNSILLKIKWFCDACQNKFGSHIEKEALSDYPFLFMRTMIGTPTKKRKPAKMEVKFEGTIFGDPRPGIISYEPLKFLRQVTLEGGKTQMRIIAETKKPDMIARFLLKMGVELLAEEDYEGIFEERYFPARKYALTGEK